MDFKTRYITPEIKLSCYEDHFFKTEIAFDHHMLVWFISGETKIIQANSSYLFKAGDIFLIPRNQLATIINYPKDGLPHQSVVMHLSSKRLSDYYSDLNVISKPVALPKIRSFKHHPLLKSCFASVIPYFDMDEPFPENIATLKITEAVSILRTIDPDIDSILANFDVPGKIDLAAFMEKNFIFNLSMEKFSYLTGRSLTTFRRDFKHTFNTTPQIWLTQKRLEMAHYQLANKKKKIAEVIYEIGFENISHFSYAFKKHFGYTPRELLMQDRNL